MMVLASGLCILDSDMLVTSNPIMKLIAKFWFMACRLKSMSTEFSSWLFTAAASVQDAEVVAKIACDTGVNTTSLSQGAQIRAAGLICSILGGYEGCARSLSPWSGESANKLYCLEAIPPWGKKPLWRTSGRRARYSSDESKTNSATWIHMCWLLVCW